MPGNKFIFIFYINYFLNKKIDSKFKYVVKKKRNKNIYKIFCDNVYIGIF